MQIGQSLGVRWFRETLKRSPLERFQSLRVSQEGISKDFRFRQFRLRLLRVTHPMHAPRRQRGVEHFDMSFRQERFVPGADAFA